MPKKVLLLAALSAGLMVFAAPAVARASNPLITNSLGEGIESVEATSTNTVMTFGGTSFRCTTVNLAVTLTDNTNTTAFGHVTGTAHGRASIPTHTGPCELSPSGLNVDIEEISATIHLDDNPGGTDTADFAYTWTITHSILGPIMCNNTGSANVSYKTGTNALSIAGTMKGTINTPPCPPEGTTSGDFTLTSGGEPAFIG